VCARPNRWRSSAPPDGIACFVLRRWRARIQGLASWELGQRLAELFGNRLGDDALQPGHECAEEVFHAVRGLQRRKLGIRLVTSCLQQREEQGVAIWKSEPLGGRLKCLSQGD